MKSLRVTLIAALLTVFVNPATQTFAAVSATPTSSTVLVDGKSKTFDSYNINGFNYFKLRDIASVVNGTPKQFAINWDGANNAMTLQPGAAYVATGDEMSSKGTGTKSATPSNQKIFLYGEQGQTQMEAYNIDGYNYFKLRDIGVVMDTGIGWDDSRNTISIDSTKGYVESQTVDSLDKAIGDAILSNYKGKFGPGDFTAQSHITLKTVQNGNNTTAYVVACYEEFLKNGDSFKLAGGAISPDAITLKKDSAGNYQVAEYWKPEQGGKFISSIQEKFPQDCWNAVNTGFYTKALEANTNKQAHDHYNK